MEAIRIGETEYVAASDLANERNVHRRLIYQAIESGRLPSVQVAGRVWVRKAEADKWEKRLGPGRPRKRESAVTGKD